MTRVVGLFVAVAMLVAACGVTDPPSSEETTSLAPPMETSTSTMATVTTTVAPTTTTATTTTPATVETTTTTVSPREPPTPVPTAGPLPGSEWWVVGVPADDVLNVRAGPGTSEGIVSTLAADGGPVVVTGEARLVEASLWWEIDTQGDDAWVNARYLGALADTWDITSWLVDRAGAIPIAGSMEELAAQVLALRGGGEATVISAGLSADGLLGEIAVDRFTAPDDSVRGERLRVFGQRMSAGDPFGLHSVEATSICWRGVDQTGLCV